MSGHATGTLPLTGSNFIMNGLSYSGADIKAVIHVYDSDSGFRTIVDTRLKEIKDELVSLDPILLSTNTGLLALQARNNRTPQEEAVRQQLDTKSKKLFATQKKLEEELYFYAARSSHKPALVTKVLAEIQTLTVSTHREKVPVRALGHVYPLEFTRGSRLIAGSMIFTVFDKHVLYSMLQNSQGEVDFGPPTTSLMDQLPPFDITIAFANEYGSIARMAILGCEFVSEGQTMSIEDLFLENTVSYVARDVDPMRSVAQRALSQNNIMQDGWKNPRTASSLLDESDYQTIKHKLSPMERHKRRSNNFV